MGREPGQRGGGSNPCLPQREPQIGPKTETQEQKQIKQPPTPTPIPNNKGWFPRQEGRP